MQKKNTLCICCVLLCNVHQCYLAVVRPYVEWVEACITYPWIKVFNHYLLHTYVHKHAYMSFCSHYTGFRCSILYESTQYSIPEYAQYINTYHQNFKQHFQWNKHPKCNGTFSVWNNFICYSCHKVINNRTYQIARMRSLILAFLQFFMKPILDIIYFV